MKFGPKGPRGRRPGGGFGQGNLDGDYGGGGGDYGGGGGDYGGGGDDDYGDPGGVLPVPYNEGGGGFGRFKGRGGGGRGFRQGGRGGGGVGGRGNNGLTYQGVPVYVPNNGYEEGISLYCCFAIFFIILH